LLSEKTQETTRQGSFHSANTIRTPLKATQTFLPLGVEMMAVQKLTEKVGRAINEQMRDIRNKECLEIDASGEVKVGKKYGT
jgi:hypothetical protein